MSSVFGMNPEIHRDRIVLLQAVQDPAARVLIEWLMKEVGRLRAMEAAR